MVPNIGSFAQRFAPDGVGGGSSKQAPEPIHMLSIDPPNADVTIVINGDEPWVKELEQKFGFALEGKKKDKVSIKGTPEEKARIFSEVMGSIYKEVLKDILTEHNLTPGEEIKTGLELLGFIEQHAGRPARDRADQLIESTIQFTPGGSSSNTLRTLKRLHGDGLEPTLIAAANDKDRYGRHVTKIFDEEGVHRHPSPEVLPENIRQLNFVNLVAVFGEGDKKAERYILKSSAPLGEAITRQMITPDLFEGTDTILLQGSAWAKQDPKVVDEVMRQRWQAGKEIIFALPTDEELARKAKGHFSYILPSTNVILANEVELSWMFDDAPHRLEGGVYFNPRSGEKSALHRMKEFFEKESLQVFRDQKPELIQKSGPQVGFVTAGEEGGYVVEAVKRKIDGKEMYKFEYEKDGRVHTGFAELQAIVDIAADVRRKEGKEFRLSYEIKHIEPRLIGKDKIKSKLGAGDTAYAGFIFGRQIGLSNEEAANVAMVLGSANLREVQAVVTDPRQAIVDAIETGMLQNPSETLKAKVTEWEKERKAAAGAGAAR